VPFKRNPMAVQREEHHNLRGGKSTKDIGTVRKTQIIRKKAKLLGNLTKSAMLGLRMGKEKEKTYRRKGGDATSEEVISLKNGPTKSINGNLTHLQGMSGNRRRKNLIKTEKGHYGISTYMGVTRAPN